MAEGWVAVDQEGRDPATGRSPGRAGERRRGAASPAAALAAVPVATWPLATVAADGRTAGVGEALGPGGDRVVALLDRLAGGGPFPADLAVAGLARATPAGTVELPVAVVSVDDAASAAGSVDARWMAAVDERRSAPRSALEAAGRATELEAAINLAMLLGTDRLEAAAPGLAARVASGAQLWLLGGGVAWALLDGDDDPFAAWAELVSWGMWPVGPVAGRLLVAA